MASLLGSGLKSQFYRNSQSGVFQRSWPRRSGLDRGLDTGLDRLEKALDSILCHQVTLQKSSFLLKISLVDRKKSTGNCEFLHIYKKKSFIENFIFCVRGKLFIQIKNGTGVVLILVVCSALHLPMEDIDVLK